MTREEAVANLNMISVAFVEPVTKEQRKLIDDTFDMAIKALKQEPKGGHWICIDDYHIGKFKCSVCQTEGFPNTAMYEPTWNYCPNCGAKMEK